MKYLLFLLLTPQFITAQIKPKEFKVTVDLSAVKDVEKLYLEYSNSNDPDNPDITDSITVTNHTVSFIGIILEPGTAAIYRYKEYPKEFIEQMKKMPGMDEEMKKMLDGPQQERYPFFLVPGETTITLDASMVASKITGPPAVLDFDKLKKEEEHYFEKHSSLMDNFLSAVAYTKGNAENKQKMEKRLDSLNRRMKDDVYLSYVRMNPASPLALYALVQGIPVKQDSTDKYIQLFYLLPSQTQHLPSAERLLARLKASKNAEIGQFVKDFKQLDSLGNKVKFSSFKGRYVLIDLWASWCIPCRSKHPELVRVYQKFSQENFTILGIALEQKDDKTKWLKAINNDKLLWTQVTDYKYWNNAVALQFGVHSIPFNLLVDPTGKIIDKNLNPSDLENRLADLFKK